MPNEVRYFLQQVLLAMEGEQQDAEGNVVPKFEPTYLVTAVRLPTGAIELAVNHQNIEDKIKYILEAYNEDMKLLTNNEIHMENILIV